MLNKYQILGVDVEKGDVVLDIGANIGEFSMAVANIAKAVISVEPDPVAYACLRLNVSEAYQVVLSNKVEEVKFYLSSTGADSSIIEPRFYQDSITLQSQTLDSFVDIIGLTSIDFLKIEAEGAEPEIIEGARSTLPVTRKVAVDTGPERNGQTTTLVVSTELESHGFQVTVIGHMVYGIRR